MHGKEVPNTDLCPQNVSIFPILENFGHENSFKYEKVKNI